MPTVKLGAGRQIVIPKTLSAELGLEAGDYLEVEPFEGNNLLVTPKALVDKHPEVDKRLAEPHFDRSYSKAPPALKRAFLKQAAFLLDDLRHPSRRAKEIR